MNQDRPWSREACAALDAVDPLGPLRARFRLPAGVVYLDGNSLGPLALGVEERVSKVVSGEWGDGLVRSWNDAGWLDLPGRCAAKLARLLGARAEEVWVCDSTSVNLFKLLWAALDLRPDRSVIVTEAGNFPTDRYLVDGVGRARGAVVRSVAPAELAAAVAQPDVAVAVISHVDYRSGDRHDLPGLTRAAHGGGALVLWDLAHSVGAMDLDVGRAEVDFAVGCGYKYLNGGPGAPGFAFVAARHLPSLASPLPGWMGHREPFAFASSYEPAPGAARLAVGTPPVLSLAALDTALDVFDHVEPRALRAKSCSLVQLFIDLVDRRHRDHDLALVTSRDTAQRGSHVAYRHPGAVALMASLIQRGVIGDVRGDLVRFGLAPLYVSHTDVWDAAQALVEVCRQRPWLAARPAPRGPVP